MIAPVTRSATNTSVALFESMATRLEASDWNAIHRPSSLITGYTLESLASVPPTPTLMRLVVPFTRSRTKMSCTLFVSFGTTSEAADANVT